jgi:hypothetical protein
MVTQGNYDAQHNQLSTTLSVTRMIFPFRHHFQDDNKQPYSHAVKLPDGRLGEIRLYVL